MTDKVDKYDIAIISGAFIFLIIGILFCMGVY